MALGILTFAISAIAVRVPRHHQPRLIFGPAEPADSISEPPSRCERTPEAPRPIKVLLNRQFPGWSFPEVTDEDGEAIAQCGPEIYPQLIKGDFDDDGRLDYALRIQQSAEANDKGVVVKPWVIHIVAFFRKPN